jgi:hypothetical protein
VIREMVFDDCDGRRDGGMVEPSSAIGASAVERSAVGQKAALRSARYRVRWI